MNVAPVQEGVIIKGFQVFSVDACVSNRFMWLQESWQAEWRFSQPHFKFRSPGRAPMGSQVWDITTVWQAVQQNQPGDSCRQKTDKNKHAGADERREKSSGRTVRSHTGGPPGGPAFSQWREKQTQLRLTRWHWPGVPVVGIVSDVDVGKIDLSVGGGDSCWRMSRHPSYVQIQ